MTRYIYTILISLPLVRSALLYVHYVDVTDSDREVALWQSIRTAEDKLHTRRSLFWCSRCDKEWGPWRLDWLAYLSPKTHCTSEVTCVFLESQSTQTWATSEARISLALESVTLRSGVLQLSFPRQDDGVLRVVLCPAYPISFLNGKEIPFTWWITLLFLYNAPSFENPNCD